MEGEPAQRQERGPRGDQGDRGEGRRDRGDRGGERGGEPGERGERGGERGGEGRRERGDRGPRNDRGPRTDASQAVDPLIAAQALAGAGGSVGDVAEIGFQQTAAADPVLESHAHGDGQRMLAEGEQPRRGRSRDRNGRERRDRDELPARQDGNGNGAQPVVDTAVPAAEFEPPSSDAPAERQRYATGFASQDAGAARSAPAERASAMVSADPVAQAPRSEAFQPAMSRPETAQRASQPAPAEAPRNDSASARALPQVQLFELPVSELVQVAEGSGLQWVNSDTAKIAAVQAAIEAEPKPIHLPRERVAAVTVQEGPLVLVETKRDLREMKLPFEQPGAPPPQ